MIGRAVEERAEYQTDVFFSGNEKGRALGAAFRGSG